MMSEKAKMTHDAVVLGIKSFNDYADQLQTFYDETLAVVEELGDTHKDQNYKAFCDFFEPIWDKMELFKTEIEGFIEYLEVERKRIEDYEDIGGEKII